MEAAISYTGDISDPARGKYNLDYYLDYGRKLAAQCASMCRKVGGLQYLREQRALLKAAGLLDAPLRAAVAEQLAQGRLDQLVAIASKDRELLQVCLNLLLAQELAEDPKYLIIADHVSTKTI